MTEALIYLLSHLFCSQGSKGNMSSGSTSSIGVAVGCFFGGVVVTLLIVLFIIIVKRRTRRNHVGVMPMTTNDKPVDDCDPENTVQNMSQRP